MTVSSLRDGARQLPRAPRLRLVRPFPIVMLTDARKIRNIAELPPGSLRKLKSRKQSQGWGCMARTSHGADEPPARPHHDRYYRGKLSDVSGDDHAGARGRVDVPGPDTARR